jgi:hypothetical protein
MQAIHGANEASRSRRPLRDAAPVTDACGGGGCGSTCGCHA